MNEGDFGDALVAGTPRHHNIDRFLYKYALMHVPLDRWSHCNILVLCCTYWLYFIYISPDIFALEKLH